MENTTHLRYLYSLTLAPTSGAVTIAAAKDVFTEYIDSDFQNWGTNQPGAEGEAISVDVFEVIKDGTFRELFGSLGVHEFSLGLSQGQIVEYCQICLQDLLQGDYWTFLTFAVKRKGEEREDQFVASILEKSVKLRANVSHFENDKVWRHNQKDRYQLVVRNRTYKLQTGLVV